VRYITQGNGSSVAGALSDFVTKYNERNPGKEVLYFITPRSIRFSPTRSAASGIFAGTPIPTSRWKRSPTT